MNLKTYTFISTTKVFYFWSTKAIPHPGLPALNSSTRCHRNTKTIIIIIRACAATSTDHFVHSVFMHTHHSSFAKNIKRFKLWFLFLITETRYYFNQWKTKKYKSHIKMSEKTSTPTILSAFITTLKKDSSNIKIDNRFVFIQLQDYTIYPRSGGVVQLLKAKRPPRSYRCFLRLKQNPGVFYF